MNLLWTLKNKNNININDYINEIKLIIEEKINNMINQL